MVSGSIPLVLAMNSSSFMRPKGRNSDLLKSNSVSALTVKRSAGPTGATLSHCNGFRRRDSHGNRLRSKFGDLADGSRNSLHAAFILCRQLPVRRAECRFDDELAIPSPPCRRTLSLSGISRMTGSRPEALRQVIFADSVMLASSGDPRFLSAFK